MHYSIVENVKLLQILIHPSQYLGFQFRLTIIGIRDKLSWKSLTTWSSYLGDGSF